jgi:uncharacterized membrane protein YeaQ/YmgE (transglycosylase-associated protein family)
MNIVIPNNVHIGTVLVPGNIIAWLVIGLIAGALAGTFVRGRGFGCLGDIVVGLIGAVIGGFIADALNLGTFHFCGSLLIAFVGACILVAIIQLFTGAYRPRRRL